MLDLTPIVNKDQMTIPELIDLLKNEPDELYRVCLSNGKIYQAIKSKGEVTTLVNTRGVIFRRASTLSKKVSDTYITPDWVDVEYLEDINMFLLVAQVKGWR